MGEQTASRPGLSCMPASLWTFPTKTGHWGMPSHKNLEKFLSCLHQTPSIFEGPLTGEWNHVVFLWCHLRSECLSSGQPNQPLGSRCAWPPYPSVVRIWRTFHSSAFLELESLPLPWALFLILCPHVPPACQVNSGAPGPPEMWLFEACNWVLYQIMLQALNLARKLNYTWGENNFSKCCGWEAF